MRWFNPAFLWKCLYQVRTIAVFPVLQLLTDFVWVFFIDEFCLSLWKIAPCSVILLFIYALYRVQFTMQLLGRIVLYNDLFIGRQMAIYLHQLDKTIYLATCILFSEYVSCIFCYEYVSCIVGYEYVSCIFCYEYVSCIFCYEYVSYILCYEYVSCTP